MADWSVHPNLLVSGEEANVPKSYFVDQATAAIDRGLNTLATTLTGLAGSVPAVRSGEDGLDYASDIDLRGRVLAGYPVGRPRGLACADGRLQRDLALVYRSDRTPRAAARAFLELVRVPRR